MNIPRLYKYLVISALQNHINDDKKIKCYPFGDFNCMEIIDNVDKETQFGKMFVFNMFLIKGKL
jgi:hypothetical protein